MLLALSSGFTTTFSPADEDPLPGGGRRARAADANDDVAVDFVLYLEMTGGLGRRMGLAAREAVWEIGALLGRVRGIYRGAGGKLGRF
jgi:hypothetical protein